MEGLISYTGWIIFSAMLALGGVCYTIGYIMTDSGRLNLREKLGAQRRDLEIEKIKLQRSYVSENK